MAEKNELVITRVFDAPKELVWRAWTEPEHMMMWWGPKEFTAPVCNIDLRVGGKYHSCMKQNSDGKEYWSTGVYKEIVPFEKLVCTDSFADENGNVIPASEYGMGDDFPTEMEVIVTFENLGGKTKLTIRHIGMPDGEHGEMANQGWNESLDKLADSLSINS